MKKILPPDHLQFAVVLLVCVVSVAACSSGVSVTATRFSGVILDRSMTVDVGWIHGNDGSQFRDELVASLASTGTFSIPSKTLESSETVYLLIRGTFRPRLDEQRTQKLVDNEWKWFREKTYSAGFEYEIHDVQSDELVINGYIEETRTETEKDEGRSFLESIVKSIVEGFLEGIFSIDRYGSLRKNVIRRFIDEISPHELRVEVKLFKDKDIPELEHGIRLAKIQKWREAAEVFQSAIDKHPDAKNLHKALYNLGVAYEYDYQFELAMHHFEKALEMEDDSDYSYELQECKRFEQEHSWRQQYLERLNMLK